MQRFTMKAFKCVVELAIHEVSAPGVRLANKDDLYLNVCLLGQQRRTRLAQAVFPLKFADNLIFEKTFKYCRDEVDVINFLDDLHVLIELIQLGRSENNEVLAWFETNAKDFLYPSRDLRANYTSSMRDLFMTRADEFPGSISPQLIFSTSTRIDETQTPSLDILREYENRFVIDPLMDMKKKSSLKSKKSKKLANNSNKQMVQFMNQSNDVSANHTISSAIKSDYRLQNVKHKLNELNESVKKTRIIKTIPKSNASLPRSRSSISFYKPFVVRKVEDQLILRKPELHDVLHDGLVLTKKVGAKMARREKKLRSKLKAIQFSRSLNSSPVPLNFTLNNSAIFHSNRNNSYEKLNELDRYHERSRRFARSLSPSPLVLGPSLNENLAKENSRKHSRNSSASSTSRNRTYDILPELSYSSENLSNCEVCLDHSYRSDPHRVISSVDAAKGLNINKKTSNKKRILRKKSKEDPLMQTRVLNTNDLRNIHRDTNQVGNRVRNKIKKNINKYPTNQSFSNYAPPPPSAYWPYARYYPWLYNYTDYLRGLEEELNILKVRSREMEEQNYGHHHYYHCY